MEKSPILSATLRLLLLVLLGFLLSSLLLVFFFPKQLYPTFFLQQLGIFLLPSLIWLKWEKSNVFKIEKKTPIRNKRWIFVSLLFLSSVYLFNDFLSSALENMNWAKELLAAQNETMKTYQSLVQGSPSIIVPVLAIALLPAFSEELLFRRVLFAWNFERNGRFWFSACISSGFFALLHFQPIMLPSMFALAMLFCRLCEQTGTIWAGVTLHALNNFLQVLQLHYDWEIPLYVWWVVLAVSASILLFQRICLKKIERE